MGFGIHAGGSCSRAPLKCGEMIPRVGSPLGSPISTWSREFLRITIRIGIGTGIGTGIGIRFSNVVSQIDRLTSDFALDLEPDAWTPATASSTSSSDRGGASLELGPLDFAASDILSDSWEFCSFLDASTPSDPGDCPEPLRPPPARLMNGGVPMANGPRGGGGTPDSSSEECFGSTAIPKIPAQRPAGTRERVRFSDKVLYHALCCDDDGDADVPDVPDDPSRKGAREQLPRNAGAIPIRRATRNSSTQTVADKSTQTLLPYVPARQRIPNKN
uniref:Inhibitory synaptic factor 1 n=1 Tax=Cyanistes caeruleus TaxID=156563 RepID=A0A8C0Z7S2_CYACU